MDNSNNPFQSHNNANPPIQQVTPVTQAQLQPQPQGVNAPPSSTPPKPTNKKRKIIIAIVSIVSIIVILWAAAGFIGNMMTIPNVRNQTTYSIGTIENMLINKSQKQGINEINDGNLPEFDRLLVYADNLIGKDAYYLESAYFSDETDTYVIKVVPKKYLTNYQENIDQSINPYLVTMTKKANTDYYDNYYSTLNIGITYEKELLNTLNGLASPYKFFVNYNPFYHGSARSFGISEYLAEEENRSGSWLVLDNSSSSSTVLIVGDSSTDITEIKKFVKENEPTFQFYDVNRVIVANLNEGESLDSYNNSNYYNESIGRKSEITIEPLVRGARTQ